jgi:hypothetical protein
VIDVIWGAVGIGCAVVLAIALTVWLLVVDTGPDGDDDLDG